MAPLGTDSTAVLDAPLTDTSSVDSEVDSTSADESTESTSEDQSSETGETKPASTEGPAADDDSSVVVNGKLAPGVAKIIKEAQQSHPRSAAALKKAIFESENFRRTFPGGMKEAAGYQQLVKQHGGPEGIAQVANEIKYFNQLDEYFTAGDPKFAEELAKPDTAEAFIKLGPSIIAKYGELNPDGMSQIVSDNLGSFAEKYPAEHGAYVAQQIAYDMSLPLLDGRSFIATVDLVNNLPIDNARVPGLLKLISAYTDRLLKASQGNFKVKAKAPATTAQPKDDTRERQLTEREQKLANQERDSTRRSWVGATQADRGKVYESELARLTKGVNLSEDDKAAIQTLTENRLDRTIKSTADFNDTLERYFAANDRQGYMRYLSQFYANNVPKAVAAAVGVIVKHGSGKKPTAPTTATNGVTKPAAGRPMAPAPAGFVRVAGRPPQSDIDIVRTTSDMAAHGQAWLKNGKRVQWR